MSDSLTGDVRSLILLSKELHRLVETKSAQRDAAWTAKKEEAPRRFAQHVTILEASMHVYEQNVAGDEELCMLTAPLMNEVTAACAEYASAFERDVNTADGSLLGVLVTLTACIKRVLSIVQANNAVLALRPDTNEDEDDEEYYGYDQDEAGSDVHVDSTGAPHDASVEPQRASAAAVAPDEPIAATPSIDALALSTRASKKLSRQFAPRLGGRSSYRMSMALDDFERAMTAQFETFDVTPELTPLATTSMPASSDIVMEAVLSDEETPRGSDLVFEELDAHGNLTPVGSVSNLLDDSDGSGGAKKTSDATPAAANTTTPTKGPPPPKPAHRKASGTAAGPSPLAASSSSSTEPRSSKSAREAAHREKVIRELLATEDSFVAALRCMVESYKQQFEEAASATPRPIIHRDDVQTIFGNLPDMYAVHSDIQRRLKEKIDAYDADRTELGALFCDLVASLSVHKDYVGMFTRSDETLRQCRHRNDALEKLLARLKEEASAADHRLDLIDMLIMPIQRVPRYILLLKEVAKLTPATHIDHEPLQRALAQLGQLAEDINERGRRSAVEQRIREMETSLVEALPRPLLHERRTLLKEGDAVRKSDNRKIRLFLFNDVLVIVKHVGRFKKMRARAQFQKRKASAALLRHNDDEDFDDEDGGGGGAESFAESGSGSQRGRRTTLTLNDSASSAHVEPTAQQPLKFILSFELRHVELPPQAEEGGNDADDGKSLQKSTSFRLKGGSRKQSASNEQLLLELSGTSGYEAQDMPMKASIIIGFANAAERNEWLARLRSASADAKVEEPIEFAPVYANISGERRPSSVRFNKKNSSSRGTATLSATEPDNLSSSGRLSPASTELRVSTASSTGGSSSGLGARSTPQPQPRRPKPLPRRDSGPSSGANSTSISARSSTTSNITQDPALLELQNHVTDILGDMRRLRPCLTNVAQAEEARSICQQLENRIASLRAPPGVSGALPPRVDTLAESGGSFVAAVRIALAEPIAANQESVQRAVKQMVSASRDLLTAIQAEKP